MDLKSECVPVSCNSAWSPQRIGLSLINSPTKNADKSGDLRAKLSLNETKLGPEVVLEDAHTSFCQKTQGGYGYDIGIHWRILAAILYGIYTWFPLNTTSRIVGKLSQVPLPRFLRGPVMRAYAWIFSVRLEEAEFHNDLARYNSISHFFRRRLIPSARPVDPSSCLTSPADGKVISCGRVREGHLEQVKGLAYTLRALLGPHARLGKQFEPGVRRAMTLPSRLDTLDHGEDAVPSSHPPSFTNVLYHCAIYLAPGDYHCFHSPADWKIDMRRHFPGRLFSVCSLVTSWLNGVFCINERAVYMGNWMYGFFAFVAVGATNVGSIHVFSDPDLVTNRLPGYLRYLFSSRRGVKVNRDDSASSLERGSMPVIMKMGGYEDVHFPDPIAATKGELFGEFNFGSTIVLIFEAPEEFEFSVRQADRVRVGQPLGHVTSAT
ncbi:unnamed protein product [Mesocestoides corti]|nr:unnamed protein product [Mesocestoides corti]